MSRKSKAAEFVGEGYNIAVTGRNVMVTDSMKDYALEKISKIERFTHRIIDVVVIMEIQKIEHRVDIVLKVNHLTIKSQACTDNIYASIDKAVDKLETQLLKYKNKLQDHHAKGVAQIEDMNVNILRPTSSQEVSEVNIDIEDENRRRLLDKYSPHKIVSKEKRPLKTLTDGEALMKVDLSGDIFLVYRSEEDQKIKVIYQRKDGDFGVIEPEA